jgi:alpha-galactosidase
MSASIRLAVIGAGSAQFSLGLVRDLCLTESLHGSTIAFMDIDADRLEVVQTLARRYADELEAELTIEWTTDRREALRDADFVINTALAGGHPQEEAERALGERHGYYRGLHITPANQFDLMLSVVRDMEELCPDAWLIQSSNPVFEGCTLMTRESDIKIVGLCHGPFGGYREMSEVMGFDLGQATLESVGFNHIVWLTDFRIHGQDGYPMLDAWIEKESESYWKHWNPRFNETQMSPAAVHMYKLYGLLPIGDASRALWSEVWWYHLDRETKQRWWGPLGGFDSDEGWSEYLVKLHRNISEMRQVARDPLQRVSNVFPPKMSGEQMVPIMDALANDRKGYFTVNVPNRGALPGIPENVVVEVPAVIDGQGIRPISVDPLPERIMLGAMWPSWLRMERLLAAYHTGDARYLSQIVLADHRTRTLEQADETLEELLSGSGYASHALGSNLQIGSLVS